HRDYSFTGSLVETAPKSLRHSCRSELTRQGISLFVLSGHVVTGRMPLPLDDIPACRHAEGTISSSDVSDVWRMASEDSDELVPGLPSIHRLSDLSDFDETCRRLV